MRPLSELGEKAATLIPLQARCEFVGTRVMASGAPACACFLGGALFMAYGERVFNANCLDLLEELDTDITTEHGRGIFEPVRNPVTRKSEVLTSVVQDLNDNQHWSRARIATWLKSEGR